MRQSADERRGHIIAATAAVVLRKGLAAATTRDVTVEAGVSVGLLNHYFTWADLRAAAFETIVAADLAKTFDGSEPNEQLERILSAAFDPAQDHLWRVWIDATELSIGDPRLAEATIAGLSAIVDALAGVLRQGTRDRVWACADPTAAAWRIMALHDGLAGMVSMGVPQMSRAKAEAHLRSLVEYECG